ncbi:hypothetical protein ABQF34_29500 [Mycolicibacterium boenickei]
MEVAAMYAFISTDAAANRTTWKVAVLHPRSRAVGLAGNGIVGGGVGIGSTLEGNAATRSRCLHAARSVWVPVLFTAKQRALSLALLTADRYGDIAGSGPSAWIAADSDSNYTVNHEEPDAT